MAEALAGATLSVQRGTHWEGLGGIREDKTIEAKGENKEFQA